jgi:hypothetical protein
MLALKLAIVPFFILAISLAGQRWGPAIAGWLSGLPVIAGPILFFMAQEQGAAFAAEAAVATMSAVCGSVCFSLGYTWTAQRHGWPLSFLAAFVVYFATVFLLGMLEPGFWLSAALSLTLITFAPRLFPRAQPHGTPPPMGKTELVVRMAAGAAMVMLATHLAGSLGPRWSGLLAMFPILGSVLAVFSHRHAGAAFTTHLLRGMPAGFYAFIAFCAVLALSLKAWGIGAGFSLAIVCALTVQGLARLVMLRRAKS